MKHLDTQKNALAAVTTASSTIADAPLTRVKRVQLLIRNNSPTTVTIALGDVQAEALAGIVLTQNQTYIESSTAEFEVWQGNVQAIGSGNSSVTVIERFRVVPQ